MSSFDKKELERIAGLARIKLNPDKEDKLLSDFEKILDHFNELKEVKTAPSAGVRARRTHLRPDASLGGDFSDRNAIIKQFPEQENEYLKIPPVFE